MVLKYFNIVHGFAIDYMHGICAGIMKSLMTYWFFAKHKSEDCSLFKQKQVVNVRMCGIKPTLNITRAPWSLYDLHHWKCSEFRNFLLFWSVPVLHDFLTSEYYQRRQLDN